MSWNQIVNFQEQQCKTSEHLGTGHKIWNFLKSFLLLSIAFTVLTNRRNREFSHFADFQKCNCDAFLQTTRARNKYVTPMSFTWHGRVCQLSSDEREMGGWSDQRRWGVWRRNPDVDGIGLCHSRVWRAHLYWSLWTLSGRQMSDLYILPDARFRSRLILKLVVRRESFLSQGADVTLTYSCNVDWGAHRAAEKLGTSKPTKKNLMTDKAHFVGCSWLV